MNSFSDSIATAIGLIVGGDAGLAAIVARSLAVSATACLIACGAGLVLGAWLGVGRFPAVLVLPVCTALTRQVVEEAERAHGEQLRSMGAGAFLRGLLIAWDERYALVTVVIACFGRAVSEVGAVMIVGGNIDGFTRVMTTAIALETSKGDLPLAMALGLVLLAVVLALNALAALIARWRGAAQDRAARIAALPA
jgi:tungstate transport system permease protein